MLTRDEAAKTPGRPIKAELHQPKIKEEWRPVPGYEGHYEVSSAGRVRSLKTYRGLKPGRIMRDNPAAKYPMVQLCREGRSSAVSVHKLVMAAFVGARPPGLQINHKNGDKRDNRLENLEYVTPTENIRHAVRTGLNPIKGVDGPAAKLTCEQVAAIRQARAGGATLPRLAHEYSVAINAIYLIVRGVSYQECPGPIETGDRLRGENNHNAKLTAADATAIRREYRRGGVSQRQLARKYGVAQSTVRRILKRELWANA